MDGREYLAFDLGASGGRAMLIRYDGRVFALTELHRFDNQPVQTADGLYWDAQRLFREIKAGLLRCAQSGARPSSVGVDTWGVDLALLDARGELLANPRHYRDPRNAAAMEEALRRVGRERIYESTGIQFMGLNTLYQLYSMVEAPSGGLEAADRLLFMPDLFNYWLTGVPQTERTIASTSQIMNARTGTWDEELLEALGIKQEIMPPIRPSGSLCGSLLTSVGEETGLAVCRWFRAPGMIQPPRWRPYPRRVTTGRTSVPARGRWWVWSYRSRC